MVANLTDWAELRPSLISPIAQAAQVDHAFQPIVSTSTLRVHGFEALARLPGDADASGVVALLEAAASCGALREVERTLVSSAISKFGCFGHAAAATLFCNVDNRAYTDSSLAFTEVSDAIRTAGLSPANFALEISEEIAIDSVSTLERLVERLARSNVRIALDDFGVGLSGLQRLLLIEPHYVKIDRCFIDGLAADQRKRAIVAKLCGLAHALGFSTVAEGVEQEEDFRAARELGCDLAQGHFIARPTAQLSELCMSYDRVASVGTWRGMSPRVAELMERIEPIRIDAPLSEAAERFNADHRLRVIPVVDDKDIVKGALFEEDLRQLLLSDFGRALLANKGVDTRVERHVRRCAIGEAFATAEAIINSYVVAEEATGLILVNEGHYSGYLTNHAVLRLAAEREVSEAREQNPLTQLPGNQSINRHIQFTLKGGESVTLALLDFDHFKAFNDAYGFAAGDRSLQMFADLLRGLRRNTGAFVGHLGGDDFFAALHGPATQCERALDALCGKFARNAESLYSSEHRQAGGMRGLDRFGAERFFPLLRASAGVLHLPVGRSHLSVELVEQQLADLKRRAKRADNGIATGQPPACAPVMMASQLERAFGTGA